MNIEEYKGVYVLAQQVDGVVGGIAFELVGEAKKLAKDLNEEVTAILIGSDIKGQADELGAYGADRVIVVDDPALKDYRTEPYTHAMASVIKKYKPEIVLIGATGLHSVETPSQPSLARTSVRRWQRFVPVLCRSFRRILPIRQL